MELDSAKLKELAEKGIELCQKNRWKDGLPYLAQVAEADHADDTLPDTFYSYLGHGISIVENRLKEGLLLCEHSVKINFLSPENFANLAAVHLLSKNRIKALKAIEKGLALDADHPALIKQMHTMGWRRPPVIGFLTRDNPLNKFLGRRRHNSSKDPYP
jgi:hypothetical protein